MWFPPAATLATGFSGVPMPLGTSHWPEGLYPQQATEPLWAWVVVEVVATALAAVSATAASRAGRLRMFVMVLARVMGAVSFSGLEAVIGRRILRRLSG